MRFNKWFLIIPGLILVLCHELFADTSVTRAFRIGSIVTSGTRGSILFLKDNPTVLSQDNANFNYSSDSATLMFGGTTIEGADTLLDDSGSAIFNEQGNDADFRIESDVEPNMFFLDASTDRIGIGTSSPSFSLDVVGTARVQNSFQIPNGASPTVDAFGEIAGDNNLWAASRGAPVFYDGTASTALINVLVSDAPANGQVPKWNTGGTITWETDVGGSAKVELNYPVHSARLSTDSVRIDGGQTNWRLLFSDQSNVPKNSAIWQGVMPFSYGGGALSAAIKFAVPSTDTANVTFGVSIMAVTSGDNVSLDTESYDTENTKTQGTPATASLESAMIITLTNADSIAAGDWIKVRLRRDGADGLTGDVGVTGFTVYEP